MTIRLPPMKAAHVRTTCQYLLLKLRCSSRHPSVSRDNGERLGWFSVLFGAASGVAQQPNPGVTISAAVAADDNQRNCPSH